KGAYTGAQQQKLGRLAEAHGGTVLLDEIGELPLEAQSKLLRFVQDKQVTPVGGTRVRKVDVRVIAATNRELGAEVAAGRFREDLYHRLNVVRLRVPPLRERPDDILYLANHFLKTYSVQYQKPARKLTREAETLLQDHLWLGNVRELQNRLMQTVILSEGEEIGPDDLGFGSSTWDEVITREIPLDPNGGASGEGKAAAPVDAVPGAAEPARRADGAAATSTGVPPSPRQALETLRTAIGPEIDEALGGEAPRAVPLGKWLGEDLVLEANRVANGVLSRGAAILGIPETTFRRKLRKAKNQMEVGLSPRSTSWDHVRRALTTLVDARGGSGADLVDLVRHVLLEEISLRLPMDASLGSELMGVTLPTYRRWMTEYHLPV
ncbi:MAG: sigma 54-interacting transcriptional regulator, partial [Acidobacteriota bacterium]